jgi:translation elongation factor P/translation initiation factor 5A
MFKKIFAKAKEIVGKIVDSAKKLFGKLKDWWTNKNGKETTKYAVATAAIVGGVAVTSMVIGAAAVKSTPEYKSMDTWYKDQNSTILRKSKSYDYIAWPQNFESLDEQADGTTICKYKTGDFIKYQAPVGVEAPKLSDFGYFGQRFIDRGYDPSTSVYSARINMSPYNNGWR